jgi:hypothetical protein
MFEVFDPMEFAAAAAVSLLVSLLISRPVRAAAAKRR